jgi:hypothetical protein
MATLHGYMDGSYDYRQMYNIKDLKGPLPIPLIKENTLLGALNSNPNCVEFTKLVMSLPDMAARFNCSQASFTVFVPLSGICLDTTDSYRIRQFILLHTLNHAYPYKFLATSPMMIIDTRLPGTKILVENLGTPRTILNRHVQIVAAETVGDAVIYYIDHSLCLDRNPLSNVA